MRKLSILFLTFIALTIISCDEKYPDLKDGIYAEIATNKGTIIAKLHHNLTPMTVANFVSLAEGTNTMVDSTYKGKKFYDGIKFHRVIKDFMIQGGDPLGTGTGGPGYKFPDEIVDSLTHKSKGIFSMANSGPATNGSQFFITLKETPWLNGKHTVFGEVIKGQEIVDSIGAIEVEGSKPKADVVMNTVTIIRKGSEAKSFDAVTIFDDKLKAIEAEKAEKEKLAKAKSAEAAKKYADLKPTATKLEDGLEIVFLNKGTGEKPKEGQTVKLYYQGLFTDGKMFDTNVVEKAKEFGLYDPNSRRAQHPMGYAPMPMKFSKDATMIPGFRDGVLQMKVGDKAVLFIPAHLGYGEKGGGIIPPNADLIFELEMIGIEEEKEAPAAEKK